MGGVELQNWRDSVVRWTDSVVRWRDSVVRWTDSVVRWTDSVVRWNSPSHELSLLIETLTVSVTAWR